MWNNIVAEVMTYTEHKQFIKQVIFLKIQHTITIAEGKLREY